jgi:hypothetical protein
MFIDFLILHADIIFTRISIFDIVTYDSMTARDIKTSKWKLHWNSLKNELVEFSPNVFLFKYLLAFGI